jgi:hypothetical protein
LQKAPQKGFYKGTERHFSCLDFIAQLKLHIPPRGKHLLRRFWLVFLPRSWHLERPPRPRLTGTPELVCGRIRGNPAVDTARRG